MFEKTTYTEQEFIEVVKTNYSIASCLMALGLKQYGGNYKTFHAKIKYLNLDITHFTGQGHLKGKTHNWSNPKPLNKILVKNSTYLTTSSLKKRILKEGLLEYKCSECGIKEWNNKKLSLQLDHINGINDDNRIENLRLLCPNCHSQTETYTGKNIKTTNYKYFCVQCKCEFKTKRKNNKYCSSECRDTHKYKPKCKCVVCDSEFIQKKTTQKYCSSKCYHESTKNKEQLSIRKVKNRPSKEQLDQDIKELGYCGTGRKYGVSDNSIRKWMK